MRRRLFTAKILICAAVLMRGGAALADEPPAAEPATPAAAISHPAVADVAPYQPQGAPANPKVDAHWDRYHDYTGATELLQALAKAYPERCHLISLGRSYGNREMWVLTITNFRHGDADQKPAMWIDGGIHANEIQASEVVLYTAWCLLEMYGRAPEITQLVDNRTFYLMPMMSPDSRDAHMYEPNTTHSPRAGQRPIGDAREGAVRDEPRDDLDKDGSLTQMRVRDPNGRWKPDPALPNLMVRAAPDEKGSYTLLGEESFNEPGEKRIYRARRDYYDPNRDWGYHWEPDYVQSGAYRYPFSILENRMVADFIVAHPNIAGAQSFHNAGGMILRGPSVKGDSYAPPDIAVFDVIGKRGEKMLPGYRYINVANDLYECYGSEIDWLYQLRGVWSLTNELFTPFNFYRKPSAEADGYFGEQKQLHEFNRDYLFGAGIVPWHEVDHPLYGKIEVGGLKKNWVRQPPSFLLEEELHRNMAFSLYHADQLPLLKIQKIDIRPLDGGLREVTVVISNERMIPSHSASDVAHKITPPDLVTIDGANIKPVLALWSPDQFFEHATEQKRHAATVRISSVPGMGAIYVRWLITGDGPVTIKLDSLKGGHDEATK